VLLCPNFKQNISQTSAINHSSTKKGLSIVSYKLLTVERQLLVGVTHHISSRNAKYAFPQLKHCLSNCWPSERMRSFRIILAARKTLQQNL